MDDLLNALRTMPKNVVLWVIEKLITEEKITFQDILNMHLKHIEELKDSATDDYRELTNKIIELWYDNKKSRDNNIKDIMHYLLDKGQINSAHEDIDKR